MRVHLILPLALLSLSAAQASADVVFDLPAAVVPSTAASGGPGFVLPINLASTDTLRAIISGTVDFNTGNSADYSADWNAAGVVVRTRGGRLQVGGTDPQFVNIGWLRLSLGNDSIGFFPLLEPNAQNGLGSSSPPETLLLNRTLGSIFTPLGFGGLSAGTILEYRIIDSPIFDNSGAFTVSAVPEPSSLVLSAIGSFGCLILLGRRQVASARGGGSTPWRACPSVLRSR